MHLHSADAALGYRRVRPFLGVMSLATLASVGFTTATLSRGGADDSRQPTKRDSVSARIADVLRTGAPGDVGAIAWRRTIRLYTENGHQPLWLDTSAPDRPSPRARALARAVARADSEALRPADYPLALVASAFEQLHTPALTQPATEIAAARFDVLLTATLASFASDLLTGRLVPRSVEPGWHIDAEAVDVDSALDATIHAPDFAVALTRLRPRAEGYTELVQALARYRDVVRRGGWPAVPDGPALRPGDTSARVPVLRRRLAIEEGLTRETGDTTTRFDGALADAVARFQARHGLETDSILGPHTRVVLNVTAERRTRQIVANLERLRWLPPHLGERYVLVNVPAFRLDAYDAGRRSLTMRVIVGADYGRRGTPVFSDSMRYVVFNPYWNVTASIAVNEILPAARRDPGYLDRNGYEIVQGWGAASRTVSPGVLRTADFRSYRYRIRQRTGPGNALGRVKFMFPNDYNVYLHDTPDTALFAQARRAFSHGCVRVERPADLAEFVLGAQGWTREGVDSAMASGVHRRVDLTRSLPVYIVYLTVFARGAEVSFRDDLYDRDGRTLRALRAGDDGPSLAARRLLRALEPR